MASFDFSILMVAKDMASKTIKGVSKEVGTLNKISGHATRGVKTLGTNLARLGAVAAVGIGVAVKSGIQSLADLENATTAVDGAIAQMGLTGQVTSAQIAGWANEIETAVDAAFDDKAITGATANLLRYGKVTTDNIRPAMEVMTDLAAKTGDVASAGELLGKALADPTKAAGRLSRYSVILTKAQQDQIKAMVEAGDVAGAQAYLLDELAKTTEGAAAAMNGPYNDAMLTLGDVTEDAQRALAIGFLPVLKKLADTLKTAMKDKGFTDGLKAFGETLASGLDSLIEIARNLPWKQIGDSLKLAGAGAKAVLGAFSSMPPWVQTAILTGWGLNRLTGGALGGIIGELGKGLVRGVLGMNAGIVNINAAKVFGGGGLPGGGGKGGVPNVLPAAGAGITAATLGSVAAIAAGVALPFVMFNVIPQLFKGVKGRDSGPTLATNKNPATVVDAVWGTIAENTRNTWVATKALGPDIEEVNATTGFALGDLRRVTAAGDDRTAARIASLDAATSSGLSATAAAAKGTTGAINSKNWSPVINNTVGVTIPISVRNVTGAQRVHASYNPPTMSGKKP